MVWKGVIPKESLQNNFVLNWTKIIEETKDKYKIEITDELKDDFVQNAIRNILSGYYAYLVKEGVMYLIFKNHMFKFSKGYPELETAREYGKFQGLLTKQMPFEYFLEHPFG